MRKIMIMILTIVLTLNIGCEFGENSNKTDLPQKDLIDVSSEEKQIINRSEDISNIIVELFGIDDATTIILNDTALIGIILSQDMDFSEELVDTITSVVKANDGLIKNIKITENESLFKEIDNIATGLMSGDSYEKYLVSINKIEDKINKKNN